MENLSKMTGLPSKKEYGVVIIVIFVEKNFCVHFRLRMVVDHIAKPLMKDGIMEGWKEDLEKLGQFPNIFCKM